MLRAPISLIQWLKPGEYRETQSALASFASEVNIFHRDVVTRTKADESLKTWFQKSAGTTQYCFLGAHGIISADSGAAIGIGASENTAEFVTWQELWDWFAQGTLTGGLWLGACRSSDAAIGLSPLLMRDHRLAVPHFYGFADSIYPDREIQQILHKLLEFTGIEDTPYLDEELPLLRAAVPETKIELYYPASTLEGQYEYVNVDEVREKTGLTFRQLLEQRSSRNLRGEY